MYTKFATKNPSTAVQRARQEAYDTLDRQTDETLTAAREALTRARSVRRKAEEFLASLDEGE